MKRKNLFSFSAENGDSTDDIFELMPHSRHYHRYFEGYRETLEQDETGKRRIIRQYVGTYYKRDCTRVQWTLIKLLYLLLSATSAVLFSLGEIRKLPCSGLPYVELSCAVASFSLFVLLITVLTCLTKRQRMDIHDYKSAFVRLRQLSLITFFCMLAAACGFFLAAVDGIGGAGDGTLAAGMEVLLAALSMLTLFLLEKRASYIQEKQDLGESLNDTIIEA